MASILLNENLSIFVQISQNLIPEVSNWQWVSNDSVRGLELNTQRAFEQYQHDKRASEIDIISEVVIYIDLYTSAS